VLEQRQPLEEFSFVKIIQTLIPFNCAIEILVRFDGVKDVGPFSYLVCSAAFVELFQRPDELWERLPLEVLRPNDSTNLCKVQAKKYAEHQ
jgi:hypothetical protein